MSNADRLDSAQVSLLLIDTWFPPSLWAAVEARLAEVLDPGVAISCYAPRPLPTLDPYVLGLDVVERLRARPLQAEVRLAIGVEMGALPVAALVNEGLLDAGALIDPNIAPLMRADGSLMRLMPAEDPEVLQQMAARMEELDLPSGDSWGDTMPPAVMEVMTGAFTGEPARVKQAELQQHEYEARAPFIRDLQVTDAAIEQLDWLAQGRADANDIEVWLSAPSSALAEHLRQEEPPVEVRTPGWPRTPVLSAPEAVAEQAAGWVRDQLAKREGPAG